MTIGSTGTDFVATDPAFSSTRWVTVVLSTSFDDDDLACNVFLEKVTIPNVFEVWVFLSGTGGVPSSVAVDFIAIGLLT